MVLGCFRKATNWQASPCPVFAEPRTVGLGLDLFIVPYKWWLEENFFFFFDLLVSLHFFFWFPDRKIQTTCVGKRSRARKPKLLKASRPLLLCVVETGSGLTAFEQLNFRKSEIPHVSLQCSLVFAVLFSRRAQMIGADQTPKAASPAYQYHMYTCKGFSTTPFALILLWGPILLKAWKPTNVSFPMGQNKTTAKHIWPNIVSPQVSLHD